MKPIDFNHQFPKSSNDHTSAILDEMASEISELSDDTDPVLLMTEPDGSMIAFFPDTFDKTRQKIDCYVYVGQHSEACLHYVHSCKALDFIADPSQESKARDFLGHLRNMIGYNPRPVAF